MLNLIFLFAGGFLIGTLAHSNIDYVTAMAGLALLTIGFLLPTERNR